jgi:hypothetical protein
MGSAFIYHNDTSLPKEEYALKIGMAIRDAFQAEGINSIVLIPFDKLDYSQWLGDRSDTQDMRASWADFKLASTSASSLAKLGKKRKICEVCKIFFEGIGKAKFCSNACRQKDKYNRSKK